MNNSAAGQLGNVTIPTPDCVVDVTFKGTPQGFLITDVVLTAPGGAPSIAGLHSAYPAPFKDWPAMVEAVSGTFHCRMRFQLEA